MVVLGVLVAFQISQWAHTQSERNQLTRELFTLRDDMIANETRLKADIGDINIQLSDLAELRKALSGKAKNANMSRIDYLLLHGLNIWTFQPLTGSYDTLVTSGNLRFLNGSPTQAALTKWQEDLANLKRVEADMLWQRNQGMGTWMVRQFSFGAVAEQDTPAQQYIARSRFRNNFNSLKNSRVLDGVLAMRIVIQSETRNELLGLQDDTRKLVSVIDKRLGNRQLSSPAPSGT